MQPNNNSNLNYPFSQDKAPLSLTILTNPLSLKCNILPLIACFFHNRIMQLVINKKKSELDHFLAGDHCLSIGSTVHHYCKPLFFLVCRCQWSTRSDLCWFSYKRSSWDLMKMTEITRSRWWKDARFLFRRIFFDSEIVAEEYELGAWLTWLQDHRWTMALITRQIFRKRIHCNKFSVRFIQSSQFIQSNNKSNSNYSLSQGKEPLPPTNPKSYISKMQLSLITIRWITWLMKMTHIGYDCVTIHHIINFTIGPASIGVKYTGITCAARMIIFKQIRFSIDRIHCGVQLFNPRIV